MALEGGVSNNGADEVKGDMNAYFIGFTDKGLQGGDPVVCGLVWAAVRWVSVACSKGC